MTVRRGEPWGGAGALGDDGVIVHSDAEIVRVVTERRRGGLPLPTFGVLGGDLARTLGGSGDATRLTDPQRATRVTVDLGVVEFDGGTQYFVAHAVVRRSWLFGHLSVVANAQFIGNWDVAPRSHPGDGRLDVLSCTLGVRDRLRARQRLASGSHVPHPGIEMRQTAAHVIEVKRPVGLWLDGVRNTRSRRFVFSILPDEVTVVI